MSRVYQWGIAILLGASALYISNGQGPGAPRNIASIDNEITQTTEPDEQRIARELLEVLFPPQVMEYFSEEQPKQEGWGSVLYANFGSDIQLGVHKYGKIYGSSIKQKRDSKLKSNIDLKGLCKFFYEAREETRKYGFPQKFSAIRADFVTGKDPKQTHFDAFEITEEISKTREYKNAEKLCENVLPKRIDEE